jgi:hypothetical protein
MSTKSRRSKAGRRTLVRALKDIKQTIRDDWYRFGGFASEADARRAIDKNADYLMTEKVIQ